MDIRHEFATAGDAFELYLQERPSGGLAREAMGRAIEARHRAGDDTPAPRPSPATTSRAGRTGRTRRSHGSSTGRADNDEDSTTHDRRSGHARRDDDRQCRTRRRSCRSRRDRRAEERSDRRPPRARGRRARVHARLGARVRGLLERRPSRTPHPTRARRRRSAPTASASQCGPPSLARQTPFSFATSSAPKATATTTSPRGRPRSCARTSRFSRGGAGGRRLRQRRRRRARCVLGGWENFDTGEAPRPNRRVRW